MFEFYLWLMVSDRAEHHWEPLLFEEEDADRLDEEDDAEYDRLDGKLRQACECVSDGFFDLLTLRYTFGGLAVSVGFARNHPLGEGVEREFLEQIAALAPRSYGVLYTMDSDQPNARGEFRVFKLANQKVHESKELLVQDVRPR